MGKLIKWLLVAAALLVVLAVVIVGAVALLFDPDDYRDEVADALGRATGRKVSVEGPLSLTLFPWLAIDTGKIVVANAAAFGPEPMLQLNTASAAVRFMPLLSGNVEVGKVTIDGLAANLAVRGDGLNNWDDMVDKLTATSDDDASTADASTDSVNITIDSIDVIDASVSYSEKRSGATYTLSDLNLSASSVDLSAPIPLSGGFAFDTGAQDMSGNVKMSTVVSIGAGGDVSLGDVAFNGKVAGESFAGEQPFSLTSAMIAINQNANTLDVNDGAFEFGPLDGTFSVGGSGPSDPVSLRGKLAVTSFAVRQLTDALKMEPILTADGSVLKAVAFDSDVALTFESLALTNLKATVDDTTISGALAITNFASGRMTFDLSGDDINLDRYLAPSDDAAVADDASDALAETALPVDLIRSLNATGSLKFTRLTMGDLPFSNIRVGIKAADSKLRLQPIAATVLKGAYTGDVQINASGKTPTLALNERIEGMDMGAMASLLFERDNIEGTFGGQFALRGQGETLADIRSTLAGDVTFALTDGVLTGTDVWYQIRRARALFKGEAQPPVPAEQVTKISNMTGTAVVNNGVATNQDLFAELPFLQLSGAGTVNLADATIDYGMNARVLERPDFLAGASAQELDEYTEAVIPLKITGELASPSIKPDIEGMARAAAKEKIDAEKDRVKRRLLDRLGLDEEEEETDEEEDLEDELKKRLKDLFGG